MSPRRSESVRRIAAIEALVCRDVGRKTQATDRRQCAANLRAAAESLAGATRVGLITGFFVPRGDVAAPETDGPVGTALLAAALAACGVPARIAVDTPCAGAVRAAVEEAGGGVAVDEVGVDDRTGIDRLTEAWRGAGVSHAVAIERCGRSGDGRPRNMRGVDVSPWTAPLDDLFLGGPWTKLAVGDGGNEIGMGRLPAGLIARTVPNGAEIACVTSCDHLVVAGVSNWGAYGLMAALAVLRARLARHDRQIPDGGTRPRRHARHRRQGRRRRRRHGAPRSHGRRLRPGDPRRADRRARVALRGGRRRTRFARHGKSLRTHASRNPRRGSPALPEVRRRLLARARPRARLPDGLRQGADRGRLAGDPDSRGVWRLGPRHLGGRGRARGGPARGLQRRGLPRPDVHHGHAAAARQRRAEAALPAAHRQRRAAPAGLRRHRADQRHRHAGAAHHGGEEGQQHLRRQRPEGVDQPRRALRPDAAAGAHHAQASRPRSAPRACRCSWSTCARRWARASPSGRSAP